MNNRFIFLCIVFGAFSLVSMPAQAGLLEFFFPSLAKKEPNLYETLEAPFADIKKGEKGQEKAKAVGLPENSVPLEKAHRQIAQVSAFVGRLVSEVMTFEDDYEADLQKTFESFDGKGKMEFEKFLADKNILKILKSKRYRVRGFIMDTPIMINAGVLDGRYRWLFEVPVMVSYMDRDMVDYKKSEPINQKIMVRLQVGRQRDVDNELSVLVESWSGEVRKLEEPKDSR